MLKQDRTIIHVEVKDTREHFYFGSAAAMFEDSRVKNLLKIKYQTFRTKRVSPDKPYENEYVIVRKGKRKKSSQRAFLDIRPEPCKMSYRRKDTLKT